MSFLLGSGLGYILGAQIATATGDWRWALRVRYFLKHKFPTRIIVLYDSLSYDVKVSTLSASYKSKLCISLL